MKTEDSNLNKAEQEYKLAGQFGKPKNTLPSSESALAGRSKSIFFGKLEFGQFYTLDDIYVTIFQSDSTPGTSSESYLTVAYKLTSKGWYALDSNSLDDWDVTTTGFGGGYLDKANFIIDINCIDKSKQYIHKFNVPSGFIDAAHESVIHGQGRGFARRCS